MICPDALCVGCFLAPYFMGAQVEMMELFLSQSTTSYSARVQKWKWIVILKTKVSIADWSAFTPLGTFSWKIWPKNVKQIKPTLEKEKMYQSNVLILWLPQPTSPWHI